MWELHCIRKLSTENWCFSTNVLGKDLESLLIRKSNQSILKKNSPKFSSEEWNWNSNNLATWWEELTHRQNWLKITHIHLYFNHWGLYLNSRQTNRKNKHLYKRITQSPLNLCNPLNCNLPGFSHGIFQTIILPWVVIFFSRKLSPPKTLNPDLNHQCTQTLQVFH